MRRTELIRRLDRLAGFPSPRAADEQVRTPAEAAAEMLLEAAGRDDLADRVVADLGCGTGVLSVGAAMLGARRVIGIDRDPAAIALARENAGSLVARIDLREGDVASFGETVDTVVMNPPFGAQRRGADRPFWETALAVARRAVYAFSLSDSRSFIERRAVERHARIELCRPVAWMLPRTFPHHRKPRVPLPVDLWVLRTGAP